NAMDDRFWDLERVFGTNGAMLAGESHGAAIDCIEAIASGESIDCDFERLNGYLFTPPFSDRSALEEEFDAVRRCGIEAEWVERAPLSLFDTGRCICFPRQGQFHPMKYLDGLVRACERGGGQIYTGTHVCRVAG